MHPLGVHSHLYRGGPAAVAEAVRGAGLDCVQLTPNFPGLPFHDLEQITPERCCQASAPFLAIGIEIAALSSQAQLLDPDLDRRHRGILRLHKLLRHARNFGATVIVAEAGGPETTVEAPSWLLGSELCLILEAALRIAVEADVRLLLKPGLWLSGCEQALALHQALGHPNFGFVLDPAGWLRESTTTDLLGDLDRLVEQLGPVAPLIYAKDLRFERDGPVTPRAGRGELDYGVFFRLLDRVQPGAPVILEHLRPEDVGASAAYLRGFIHT